jgi:hypothetical protein
MNYTFIILGIFLVIVLWVLYRKLMAPTSVVSTQTYLQSIPKSVLLSSISNSNSIDYYYSVWVYVNNLNSPADDKSVVSLPTELSTLQKTLPNNIFYVTDTANKPYLSLDVSPTTSLTVNILLQNNNDKLKEYEITPNFSLQRWECVIISVNQSYIDLYLNGKLIKSANLGVNTQVPPSSGSIQFGNGDVYIAGLQRIPNAIDPQTAWDMYLTGSGTTKSPLNYGLSMTLSKNNAPKSTITLF